MAASSRRGVRVRADDRAEPSRARRAAVTIAVFIAAALLVLFASFAVRSAIEAQERAAYSDTAVTDEVTRSGSPALP